MADDMWDSVSNCDTMSTCSSMTTARQRISQVKGDQALQAMVTMKRKIDIHDRLEGVRLALKDDHKLLETVEAIIAHRQRGRKVVVNDKPLARGIITVMDVPFYLLKEVLSRLTGIPPDVFQNLPDGPHTCMRLWIWANNGEFWFDLPKNMTQEQFFLV